MTSPHPPPPSESNAPALPAGARHAPATVRNREPLLAVLRAALPAEPGARVLEIAAGTGEHALAFAGALPHLTWQPTDPDAEALTSIAAWTAHARAQGSAVPNLAAPLALDAAVWPWPAAVADGGPVAAMVCINMIHIAPWEACVGLMRGAGALLPPGGPLVLYGPYRHDGAHTAPSNEAFDGWLKARDPRFGVRDLEAVAAQAAANGLALADTVAMPANNFSLIFRKQSP